MTPSPFPHQQAPALPASGHPAGHAGWRVGVALAALGLAALLLWLGAAAVCGSGACTATSLDRQWLHALSELRAPWLDGLMKSITWLGSMLVLVPAALLLAWRRWRFGHRLAAMQLLVALGGAWMLAHAAKMLAARPRPDLHPALIDMPADAAFPSAHAMQITAFALAWWFTRPGRRNAIALAIALLAITLVALSRLYLQVHFPSDVIAGLLAGAAWATGLRLAMGRTS